MTAPSILNVLAPTDWPTLVLVTARVVGLVMIAPLWALAEVPTTVRGAMVVVMSLALLPTVHGQPLPSDVMGLPLPLAAELLLGLAIGLTGAVFMYGISLAGEVAALQMGLNLGPALNPMAEGSVSGVGELKSMFAMVTYVGVGGHLALITALAASFHSIPPGGAIDLANGSHAVVALGATVFTTALRAAAPLIAALMLANFALAILSRAVPQLNAMAVAFPITIGLGLVVFGASLPYTGQFIDQWAHGVGRSAATMVQAFTPAGAR